MFSYQNSTLSEAPWAKCTSEGFLIGVNAQMLGQMTLLSKSFSAFGTSIRPTICMYPIVLQQRTFLLEILPARHTLEQSQIRVFLMRPLIRTLMQLIAMQEIRHRITRQICAIHFRSGHSRQHSPFIQIMMEWRKPRRSQHPVLMMLLRVIIQFRLIGFREIVSDRLLFVIASLIATNTMVILVGRRVICLLLRQLLVLNRRLQGLLVLLCLLLLLL